MDEHMGDVVCVRCVKSSALTVPFLPHEYNGEGACVRICEACCQQLLWQAQAARERAQAAAGWL